MSISGAINAALSGLQTTSLQSSIVASNIANASTPGYVRRSVILSETLVGGDTSGVHASGIARSAAETLTTERRAVSSDLAQTTILTSTWQTLSAKLGDSASGFGLFSTFTEFESALSTAATTPESGAALFQVVQSAGNIADELNTLYELATSLRSEADREIADAVTTVNDALRKIEMLNGEIARTQVNTEQSASLRDERDRLVDTIAEFLPINTFEKSSGAIDITTDDGVFLLAGSARTLEFNASFAFDGTRTLAGGDLSGLSVDGVDLTPGASSYGALSSGMFGALFTARDADVPDFMAQLDTIAQDLMDRLSATGVDPTLTPGDPGLFVDSGTAGVAGVAGRIEINALVDPSRGGEVWRVRDGLGAVTEGSKGNSATLDAILAAVQRPDAVNENGLQGAFSTADLVAHFSSLTGQKRISHEAVLASVSVQFTALENAEIGETGVDIDTEMQELLLIEEAYAANARIIQIASELLDLLMEI